MLATNLGLRLGICQWPRVEVIDVWDQLSENTDDLPRFEWQAPVSVAGSAPAACLSSMRRDVRKAPHFATIFPTMKLEDVVKHPGLSPRRLLVMDKMDV